MNLSEIYVDGSLYGNHLLALNVGFSSSFVTAAKTSYSNVAEARERFEKRLERLNDILPVASGRVIPDDDLMIGGARRLNLTILFLDICGFSQNDSGDSAQQDRMLKLCNLFMAEMLHVIKAYSGCFEKDTGDGFMAYFGEAIQSECLQRAVDAAITMHCYNDHVISPRLEALGLPAVSFRIGIESGLVTAANIGIRGDHRSLDAIGNAPNVACKLMTLIPHGGIVIGNDVRELLSDILKKETTSVGPLSGFVMRGTQVPYPAWSLKYRAPTPIDWTSVMTGVLGGKGIIKERSGIASAPHREPIA